MERPAVERPTSGIPRLSKLPVPSARSTNHQSASPRTQLQDKVVNLSIPRRRPGVQGKESFTSSRSRYTTEGRAPNVSNTPRRSNETSIEPVQELADNSTAFPQPGPQRDLKSTGAVTEPISQDSVVPEEPKTESRTQRTNERKPRLSLSERTIQTISRIPPSPSPGRRRSSFYQPQSPMVSSHAIVTPSRPKSRLQEQITCDPQQCQVVTSTGTHLVSGLNSEDIPISSPAINRGNITAPQSRLVNTSLTRSQPAMETQLQTQNTLLSRSKSPVEEVPAILNHAKSPWQGSKNLANKTIRPRATPKDGQLGSSRDISGDARRQITARDTKEKGTPKVTTSRARPLHTQADISPGSDVSMLDESKASKSSAALRQAIAKAKAARKLAAQKQTSPEVGRTQATSNNEGLGDYVGPTPGTPGEISISTLGSSSLSTRVETARTSGRLNISVMGLREIPRQVLNMYQLESLDSSKGAWYESVDLIHFIAADNELEHIGSEVFPDLDYRDISDESDGIENVFGGLESLDLHGNKLRELPVGLRQLERLTSLNLSSNNLGKECLDVLSQCLSLKILRLANNELVGELDERLTHLTSLEVLDVAQNSITSLPGSLMRMVHLRSLNVSGNGLTSLPLRVIAELPVTELLASKNRIGGTLLPADVRGMASLQVLDLSDNALSLLTELSTLRLDSLRQLNLARNRLTALPDISAWTELVTLDLSENRFPSLPDGFIHLNKIKQAYFTSNSLKKLDDRIGMMESLEILKITNNPLRPLRYLTMPTEDLKHDLRLRLEPGMEEQSEVSFLQEEIQIRPLAQPGVVEEQPETWPVTSGGLLDRSSKGLGSLDMTVFESTSTRYTIRSANFQHNLFDSIPVALSTLSTTLTKLTLAHNKMEGDYLTSRLELSSLIDLNISCNSIISLIPLMEHLTAPSLSNLDVSANRISTLPILRKTYPNLYTLIANDNRISELDVESVDGLKVVDLRNNNIAHLPPKLGALRGIDRLDVMGNVFRVPKWTVLEKGTRATLAWLRDRIPVDERVDDVDQEEVNDDIF
ncbi:MAG: hypothetical protein M1816_000608 [Peltula sp. TS41687]|nr:MAG: hypothetical protein M1816_000608 [Peltula sp. TS41687]